MFTGRADVVRLLTDECEFLDLNARTQRGPASTPLHLAAERGHIDTVISLIDCGASLWAVDRRCRTAKDIAVENGQRQVVVVITAAEVEKSAKKGDVMKLTEVSKLLGYYIVVLFWCTVEVIEHESLFSVLIKSIITIKTKDLMQFIYYLLYI